MRPLLALVVLVLVAGCFSGAPGNKSPPPSVLPVEPFAAVISVIDHAGGQGEPSLGIAPDGSLYTNGVGGGTAATDSGGVYQSKDGGRAWKVVGTPTSPMPDEDADLVVDKEGAIWFSTLQVSCSTVAVSKDQGKTWATNNLGCVPPAGDRQYVVATKGGTAYIYSHHIPTFYQTVAKTTDYGATWTPSGIAEGPLGATHGQSGWGGGGFWNEAKDSVHLTFSWIDDVVAAQNGAATTAWRPADSISRDQGKTWEMVEVPNGGGETVGLSLVVGAADKAGNVYLAWAEAKGQDMTVFLSVSRDDGKTWSKTPIVVDADANSKVFPAIAAFDAGHVAIAYYHADQHEYPSRVGRDARWNVTLAWTGDALAAAPSFTRANLSNQTLHVGPICPDGTLCQGNRELLDYFALKALSDGRVASVWTSTEDVKGKLVNVFAATADPLLHG